MHGMGAGVNGWVLTDSDGPLPASPTRGEVKSRGSVFDCAKRTSGAPPPSWGRMGGGRLLRLNNETNPNISLSKRT